MTLRLSTLQKTPRLFIDIRDLLEEIAKAEDPKRFFDLQTKARQILEAAEKEV